MKLVCYKDFLGVCITIYVHSSLSALRAWNRKYKRRPYAHELTGFCSHYVKPTKVQMHLGPYEPDHPTVLHEIVHAVDFACLHIKGGKRDRMEMRAYLTCALMAMYRVWYLARWDFDKMDVAEPDYYFDRARGA